MSKTNISTENRERARKAALAFLLDPGPLNDAAAVKRRLERLEMDLGLFSVDHFPARDRHLASLKAKLARMEENG